MCPLTPARSPSEREREYPPQAPRASSMAGEEVGESGGGNIFASRPLLSPRPVGWGEGQGERFVRPGNHAQSTVIPC